MPVTVKAVDETLAVVLLRLGALPRSTTELEWLLGIVMNVCDATEAAHARGMISCNLEPGNIEVGKLGDVHMRNASIRLDHADAAPGYEALLRTLQAQPGLGTAAYMAPEQAWGRTRDFDRRTDVYGIGGILYAILTLTAPHDGGDPVSDLVLAKTGTVRAPSDLCPGRMAPVGLCRIALRALSANPSDRHPSVELLRQDIERFLRAPKARPVALA